MVPAPSSVTCACSKSENGPAPRVKLVVVVASDAPGPNGPRTPGVVLPGGIVVGPSSGDALSALAQLWYVIQLLPVPLLVTPTAERSVRGFPVAGGFVKSVSTAVRVNVPPVVAETLTLLSWRAARLGPPRTGLDSGVTMLRVNVP